MCLCRVWFFLAFKEKVVSLITEVERKAKVTLSESGQWHLDLCNELRHIMQQQAWRQSGHASLGSLPPVQTCSSYRWAMLRP